MNTQETIANNRLIAEFMGHTVINDGISEHIYYKTPEFENGRRTNHPGTETVIQIANLYNTSWDWLMPVFEKINDFPVQGKPEIRIGLKTHVYYAPLTKDGESEQKLSASFPDGSKESVYMAVLQFIEWYNENKEA